MGYTCQTPSLHQFVVSGPAVVAAIRIQHAFESKHSQDDCLRLIDEYCNQGGDRGLTEGTMRLACGLPQPPKGREGRTSNTSMALRQAVEGDDVASQMVDGASNPLVEQSVHKLERHMLTNNQYSVTPLGILHVRLSQFRGG